MRVKNSRIQFQSVPLRKPFKFGASTVHELETAAVKLMVESKGRTAIGTGAMTLGNAWSFPHQPHEVSRDAMKQIVTILDQRLPDTDFASDPFDAAFELRKLGFSITREVSLHLFQQDDAIPHLCSIVCSSCFDMALLDAWGRLAGTNTFTRIRQERPGRHLLQKFGYEAEPALSLGQGPVPVLKIYHTVGALDPLTPGEILDYFTDDYPDDLQSWIARDGVSRFKIKLTGDPEADFHRMVSIDKAARSPVIARYHREPCYSLDMNEQCTSAATLLELLKRIASDVPRIFSCIEYVEQPTPRDATPEPHELAQAARLKPIMLDEGLTDFNAMEAARAAGYTGVCIKACKGVAFSLLVAAAARKTGMHVCAQDLTCMGYAFLVSASLAAWCGMHSLEANARQYCPIAHDAEAHLNPEVFLVREGLIITEGLRKIGLA